MSATLATSEPDAHLGVSMRGPDPGGDQQAGFDAREELLGLLLAAASHDLKEPLAGVKAAASLLASGDMRLDPGDARELAGIIIEEVDRLSGIIGAVLDVERLQTGRLVPETRPTAIPEVVHAVLRGLRLRAKSVSVRFETALAPVAADPALLERAISNLVDNALAVSPPGSPVHLRIRRAAESVEISVIDEGRGIAPADRRQVLSPFGHARGRTWLGLVLVARFVEAMAGDVSVTGTPGGGTTMTISIPLAARP